MEDPNEDELDNSSINNDSDIRITDTGMDGEINMQEKNIKTHSCFFYSIISLIL